MSVSLSSKIQWNPAVKPSEFTKKKTIVRNWNDEVFAWLDGAGFRSTSMVVTVAGPPNCSDRPWWFGRVPDADERHRSSQEAYARDRELEEKTRTGQCICPQCKRRTT
jgi:hypothetical protein